MIKVRIAPYHKRSIVGEQAIITIAFPDNRPPYIKKKKIPTAFEGSRKKAERWATDIAITIAKEGRPSKKKALPPAPPTFLTFGEFVKRYLKEHLLEGGLAKTTYHLREQQLGRYLLPLFEDTPLDQIGVASFAKLKSSLVKTMWDTDRGARHRNLIMGLLYQILSLAHTWEVLPVLPPKPKRQKEIEAEIEIYTDEELARLKASAKEMGTGPYLFVLLGCEAGLRSGEILGLNWSDLDMVKRVLRVQRQELDGGEEAPPKGGRTRKVPLTDALYEALESGKHLVARVIVKHDGSHAQRSTLQSWLEYAEKRAKLMTALSPHKLRHTFASRLLARNVSIKAVQKLLGHASLKSTMVYLHAHDTESEVAIRRLSGDSAETITRRTLP